MLTFGEFRQQYLRNHPLGPYGAYALREWVGGGLVGLLGVLVLLVFESRYPWASRAVMLGLYAGMLYVYFRAYTKTENAWRLYEASAEPAYAAYVAQQTPAALMTLATASDTPAFTRQQVRARLDALFPAWRFTCVEPEAPARQVELACAA